LTEKENNSIIELLQPLVSKSFHEETIARSEYLIREGQIESFIYIIFEGAVHAYYLNGTDEISIRFGYKGSIITSLASMMSKSPSELFIQAIRKTRLVKIPTKLFLEGVKTLPSVRDLYMNMLEDLVVQQLERELDLITSSPTERYERVLKRSPKLFQEIPAKYIASYLRMTPETLSRIRKS